MIKSVTITNYLQESVKIELTEPESSGFIIRSIEGLGPAKANVNFTELATLDGALDNGTPLLDTRNIVLSLIFVGTPTIEDTRLKSYKYFPIKQNLTFEIETDNRHCFTVGRVESNVPAIFGTDKEGCQISILCPDSYFQDMEDTVKEFYSVEGGFEFPLEDNSVERIGKNLIFLEMLRWRMNGLIFDMRPNNVVNVIGAATRNTRIAITETVASLTSGNSYRLSGCPSYGGNSRFRLEVWDNNGNLKASDTGSGVTFTASSSETHIVKIFVLATYEINDTFKPILEPVINNVPTGSDLLKMADASIVRADNVEFDIINDGTIHVFGTYSQVDGPIELWLSRISNIENDHEYLLSGCPENEDEEDPQYELCVEGMDGVERAIDVGSGATFQKTNDQEFDTLKLKLGFPVMTYDYRWANASILPDRFKTGSAVVLGNKLHVLKDYKHYTWDGNTWTELSVENPYECYETSCVVLNDEIHMLGGGDDTAELSIRYLQHYKWDGTSWTEVSTLPYGFKGGTAVVLNEEIHIIGCSATSLSYNKAHYKWDGTSWIRVSTLPLDFNGGSVVVFNNEIHILGSHYSDETKDKQHYKWDGTSWTEVSTLPYMFSNKSAVVYHDEIHILGEINSSGTYTEHYKWDGTSWTEASTLPYRFYGGIAVVYEDTINILGSGVYADGLKHYKYEKYTVGIGTNIPEGEELDLTFRPMIRDSSIEDPTFESPHVMTDSGAMLEFSNVETHFTDNIFYDGDSEVGIVAEIHSSGSVSDLAIYKPETNEMIKLSNSKLVQILGEGIKDGDVIYVSTVKGNKYVRILRNGVYHNVLNALVKPITWFNLIRGDNVFSVTALSGESNLLFKISYRKTYEGV